MVVLETELCAEIVPCVAFDDAGRLIHIDIVTQVLVAVAFVQEDVGMEHLVVGEQLVVHRGQVGAE